MGLTAPIIEWNREKGYGFLQHRSSRLFLHIRDFRRRRKEPRVGDIVSYKVGKDVKGRECAVDALFEMPRRSIRPVVFFPLLLILPVLALRRFGPLPQIVIYYLLAVSVITFIAYAHDKSRARSGGWRVPESTLHFLELVGGWPAAYLAQCILRHKTSKRSFKAVFWLIVLVYQFLAFDYLQDFRLSKAVHKRLELGIQKENSRRL